MVSLLSLFLHLSEFPEQFLYVSFLLQENVVWEWMGLLTKSAGGRGPALVTISSSVERLKFPSILLFPLP